MPQYKIEELLPGELPEALEVIKTTFLKFEAPGYPPEGCEAFFRFANADVLQQRLTNNMKMYTAKAQGKIVGVIAFSNFSHIHLLFVLEEYQRKGIAAALYGAAETACRAAKAAQITVNAAPYAYAVYQKFGFAASGTLQIADGIEFYPMRKEL